jgi:hypothetical protein
MSDYQDVQVTSVEGDTIRLQVSECHPDMTELRRIVDARGQVRNSVAKRARNFAALLLRDHQGQANSFVELLQFLVDVGAAKTLADAAQRLISDVRVEAMRPIGEGTDGPMHRADVVITARSSLVFRSFRKGKGHAAVATLGGDIELF